MLIEEAKEIAIKLKLADHDFTTGWGLQKFKVCHGITC